MLVGVDSGPQHSGSIVREIGGRLHQGKAGIVGRPASAIGAAPENRSPWLGPLGSPICGSRGSRRPPGVGDAILDISGWKWFGFHVTQLHEPRHDFVVERRRG
ncbi:hypothetical protein [Bradyrhizobium brasilense]|uniref:hypothetical protein n=1 Tax=Bradyrhizobium brasilense TaxID=1419277 RepID=UPI0015A3A2DF|nr:hypothetical protein [Bradyrhizobium brasilense]